MRLWTLHPKYLDAKGLVAVWREALLAQKVLQGKTKGYRNHPQLSRFRQSASPLGAIAGYLRIILEEAQNRGYCFTAAKILKKRYTGKIEEARGQMDFEWRHLLRKLKVRSPKVFLLWEKEKRQTPHPLFRIKKGPVSVYEKIHPSPS